MWWLYQAGMGAALLLLGPFLWWSRRRHYVESLSGRLGGGTPPARTGSLWVHAVSVGEVGVAAILAKALPASIPLLVTTVTPTGQARARDLFGDRAEIAYLPFDIGFAVQRFYRRHLPQALILVEGDYWPLVLREARRRQLPVTVVNGRVSDRAYPRLLRFRRLLDPLFGGVQRFGLQTTLDRDRLGSLGVSAQSITVTGNLKFEIRPPRSDTALAAWLEAVRDTSARPLWVVGSTMPGEEELILAAWERSGRAHLPILAPRHPERFDEVALLLENRGLRVARRSRGLLQTAPLPSTAPFNPRSPHDPLHLPHPPHPPHPIAADVLLLDTLGELAALYAHADAATVGGTLVSTGGHNPLEPAAASLPIAVGPHMENFREIAEAFDTAGAWRRIGSPEELGGTLREWADNPAAARRLGERGRAVLEAHSGSLERTLDLLRPVLDRWKDVAA